MARAFLSNLARARDDANVGLIAEFANPGELYQAVKELRKAGYARLDTFSPFPIHGMDRAMGLGPSPLGYLVIVGGLTGCALALLMQWYMNDYDYAWNISGKPFFAIEQAVPVTFEVTVLLAALTAVVGMLVMNGLPRPYNPLFYSERFGRATDDGFFVQVSVLDRQFDRADTADVLRNLGALYVEYVDHSGAYRVAEGGALIRVQPAPAPRSPSTRPATR